MININININIFILTTLHNIYYTHIYISKIRVTEAHYSYK